MNTPSINQQYHCLATTAHRFLLKFDPTRLDETRAELDAFCSTVDNVEASPALLEAFLLKLLLKVQKWMPYDAAMLGDEFIRIAADGSDPLSRFRGCMVHLLECYAEMPDAVCQALRILETTAPNPAADVRSVANAVGLRPNDLCRLLQRHTGRGFQHHHRRARIRHALNLLQEAPGRIKEVWVTVGYNSASEFDRDFRRHVGVAPRMYRSLAQGGPATMSSPIANKRRIGMQRTSLEQAADRIRPPSVLLIDDDDTSNFLAAKFLREAGFNAVATTTGESGLQLARQYKPIVAVVDYRLPDADGMDVVRTLSEGTTRQKLILLTGDCSAAVHIPECRALDVRLLYKPVDGDDLVRIVRQRAADLSGTNLAGWQR